MKTPKFLSKLSAVLTPRPKKKLQATARAARQTMDDYDDEEPTTKLSSALIVVIILHVILVGGIYAFNSIKASRKEREAASRPAEMAAPAASKQAAPENATAAPVAPGTTTRRTETAAIAPAISKPAGSRQHEVKAGDNLTKIAFAYSVTPAEIVAANQLKEGAVLHNGQILVIPAAKAPAHPAVEAVKTTVPPTVAAKTVDVPPTKTTPGQYTVKKGDTLTSISKSFGVSPEEISKLNKITDPKKLQLGQSLKLPRKS
jgi:LysM repeat protein